MWDRRGELRKGRLAAETLAMNSPDVASVRVELEFRSAGGEAHVPQVYSMFPPAKVHFVYPCPYGDCGGLYDLQAVGLQTLKGRQKRAHGTLKCTGSRSGDGGTGRPCELQLSYSITLAMTHLAPTEARPASAAAP